MTPLPSPQGFWKRCWAVSLPAVLLALLTACGGSLPKPEPTALADFQPRLVPRLAWESRLDGVDRVAFVSTQGDDVLLATRAGVVHAVEASTGRLRWRRDLREPLATAAGSDGQRWAVITQDQELLVNDFKGGTAWRARLDARAVTAPLVAGDRVFVMTLDRTVRAFDGATGAPLWTLSKPGEPLALDVPGILAPMQNTLLASRGSRLLGVDPDRGESRWELSLAAPRGTNEVERLSDLVGPIVRTGPQAWCARAFQAGVSCVDASRPALTWQRKQTGHRELAFDGQHVFGADATDRLSAWKLSNGDTVWSSDAWAFRQLTGMASLPQALIFGDGQGWLHWVAPSTGATLARLRPDGSAIALTPVVVAGTVIVTTTRGAVYAYRVPS